MIPKIVHYSWFSGDSYPEHLKACMDTWKKVLPDYEFVLWDAKRLAECNNVFANEAVSVRKWAFAADFVRLYAVYHYGGIWLDTDVELFKSFDPFLNDGSLSEESTMCIMIRWEWSIQCLPRIVLVRRKSTLLSANV